jgi:hypothetical protein
MILWVLSQGCEAVVTSQLSCLSGRIGTAVANRIYRAMMADAEVAGKAV